jgi:hypothetical protein
MSTQVPNPASQTRVADERGLVLLFLSLLFLLITYPLFEDRQTGAVALDIVFSVILVSSTYVVSHQRKVLVAALALAVPTFVSWWAVRVFASPVVDITGLSLSIVFFVFVIAVILRSILLRDDVTVDVIFGAMSVYLLLGVVWTFIFAIVEISNPGSFSFAALGSEVIGSTRHGELRFLSYFSLVTLTTLGYGDITPIAPAARSLASLEALVGQLYIAVLVARLVGMHIAQKQSR